MPTYTQEERIAYRRDIWSLWLAEGLKPMNGWDVGYCPLHDRDKLEPGSGEYNFNNGTFRCTRSPRCHNRAGMSLSQLADAVIRRG